MYLILYQVCSANHQFNKFACLLSTYELSIKIYASHSHTTHFFKRVHGFVCRISDDVVWDNNKNYVLHTKKITHKLLQGDAECMLFSWQLELFNKRADHDKQ